MASGARATVGVEDHADIGPGANTAGRVKTVTIGVAVIMSIMLSTSRSWR